MSGLDQNDLVRLVRSVFPHREGDRALAILVDVPRDASRDNDAWRERRRLAAAWHAALKAGAAEIPLEEIDLVAYPDTGSNNADLPGEAVRVEGRLPETAEGLAAAGRVVCCLEQLAPSRSKATRNRSGRTPLLQHCVMSF